MDATSTNSRINRYSFKYWSLTFALILLRGFAYLPYPVIYHLGKGLGILLYATVASRRHIAKVNIDLCFPEFTARERKRLVKENFKSTGIGLLENSLLWLGPNRPWEKYVEIEGMEHYENAKRRGKGIILLSFHFTHLEIGGSLLACTIPLNALYRKNEHPVVQAAMHNGREKFANPIPRENVKALLRCLKNNETVWYAADQDYGRKQSVFLPFFGIPAATITATSRYVKITGASVVPFTQKRIQNGKKVLLTLHPPLPIEGENFEDDARKINSFLEDHLRRDPVDYLWIHKRFKTRPDIREGGFYTTRKWCDVTPKVYRYLIDTAEWIKDKDGEPYKMKNDQGIVYFVYRKKKLLSALFPSYRKFIRHLQPEFIDGIKYSFQGMVLRCEFKRCDLVYLQAA